MALLSFLIPVLYAGFLVAGVLLIVRGVRGTISVSEPHCRRCKYELRQVLIAGSDRCPECGADLADRRVVAFGRARRRPLVALGGVGLIVIPILVSVVIGLVATRMSQTARGPALVGAPGGFATMTGAQLAAAAGQGPTGPWLWQEIERRQRDGTMTADDLGAVADAVSAGIAAGAVELDLVAPWGGELLRTIVFDESVPEGSRKTLARAMAPRVTLETAPRVKQGAARSVGIELGRTGFQMRDDVLVAVHDIRAVAGDIDRPLAPPRRGRDEDFPIRFQGSSAFSHRFELPADLPPGAYEIRADVEVAALFEEPPLLDERRRPRHPDKWAPSLVRERETITTPLRVIGPDEQVVPFLPPEESAAAAAEFRAALGHVGLTVSRDGRGRTSLALLTPSRQQVNLDEAYCFEIVAIIGDVEVSLGLRAGHGGATSTRGGTTRVDTLPADVTTAVIEMRPAPDEADRMLAPDDNGVLPAIIGRTIRFEDVEIERAEG